MLWIYPHTHLLEYRPHSINPGVTSLIAAWPHTFVEIYHEMFSVPSEHDSTNCVIHAVIYDKSK